jgi:hypothetical protein
LLIFPLQHPQEVSLSIKEKDLMPKNSASKANTATLPPTAGGSEKAPHKVWTGTLTFGLISMPMAMLSAATEERVGFNQLHGKCRKRIQQQLFCPTCTLPNR